MLPAQRGCAAGLLMLPSNPPATPGRNGLMYTTDPSTGNVTFHMYFQSSDPGQSLGSIWGHTSSPDLVHWQREKRTGMRGSSGGGVALPKGFVPPPELAGARAVAVSSVPMAPSLNPPTGLHLWYSRDEKLLNWTEYRNDSSVQNNTNATCVICPEDVPAMLRPGYIGDNYVWVETGPGSETAFYVLSGSTRCAAGHPWCSYSGLGGGSTAQAFVFKSLDLLHWKLVSDWDFLPKQDAWPAGFDHSGKSQWPGQRIDTPDTFPLASIETGAIAQVFVWLNGIGCNTHWMLGSIDNSSKAFTPSTKIGCADRGVLLCQQSLTIPTGERVSIGWVEAGGPGWDGAQSLPRVVTLDRHGLLYTPLPALASLHKKYHFAHHHTIAAGATQAMPEVSAFGAALHMILTLEEGKGTTGIGLSLLGGAVEVRLKYVLPPSANGSCSTHAIQNNTDTTNVGLKLAATATNHSVDATWCQTLCCADPTCAAWTFTDPQPGTNGSSWDCWFKGAGSVPFASACGAPGGHCWSGVGNNLRRGSWMAEMGAPGHHSVALGAVRPSAGAAPPLQIFVDGSIVELYFGGEVLTQNYGGATSQNVSVTALTSAAVGGAPPAPVVMRIDAWEMQPSVVGGPE
eukprot:SAG22_NODE_82_length_21749_cov_10.719769_1_plen_626_part_00